MKLWQRKFISEKVDFITRSIIKNKCGCFQVIQCSIKQEDKTLLNVYVCKIT